jgi:hypothetical protein
MFEEILFIYRNPQCVHGLWLNRHTASSISPMCSNNRQSDGLYKHKQLYYACCFIGIVVSPWEDWTQVQTAFADRQLHFMGNQLHYILVHRRCMYCIQEEWCHQKYKNRERWAPFTFLSLVYLVCVNIDAFSLTTFFRINNKDKIASVWRHHFYKQQSQMWCVHWVLL